MTLDSQPTSLWEPCFDALWTRILEYVGAGGGSDDGGEELVDNRRFGRVKIRQVHGQAVTTCPRHRLRRLCEVSE